MTDSSLKGFGVHGVQGFCRSSRGILRCWVMTETQDISGRVGPLATPRRSVLSHMFGLEPTDLGYVEACLSICQLALHNGFPYHEQDHDGDADGAGIRMDWDQESTNDANSREHGGKNEAEFHVDLCPFSLGILLCPGRKNLEWHARTGETVSRRGNRDGAQVGAHKSAAQACGSDERGAAAAHEIGNRRSGET